MNTNIHGMTTEALEAEYERYENHSCSYEDSCVECRHISKVEKELEARELWESDDARVRESVGNYR
jgi:hypothetical protein